MNAARMKAMKGMKAMKTDADRAQFEAVFQELDRDGDRHITKAEFKAHFTSIRLPPISEAATQLLLQN